MEQTSKYCNAVGKQLNVGDLVGWTSNKGGFSYIFIGTVKSFSEKQVAINVISKKRCLYEYDFEDEKIPSKAVSVRSYMLFPVNEKDMQ